MKQKHERRKPNDSALNDVRLPAPNPRPELSIPKATGWGWPMCDGVPQFVNPDKKNPKPRIDFLGALEQADKRTRRDNAPGVFGPTRRGNTTVDPETIRAMDQGIKDHVRQLEEKVGPSMVGAGSPIGTSKVDQLLSTINFNDIMVVSRLMALVADSSTEARSDEDFVRILCKKLSLTPMELVDFLCRIESEHKGVLDVHYSARAILGTSRSQPGMPSKRAAEAKMGLDEQLIIDSTKTAKPKDFAKLLSVLETSVASAISRAQRILEGITPYCPESLKERLEKFRQNLRLAQITIGDPDNAVRQDEKGEKK